MADERGTSERRQSPRYALKLVGSGEVLYRRAPGADDVGAASQKRFKLTVVNVSGGGLMLAYDAELSAGDHLRLHYMHPERREPSFVEGKLTWMRRNASIFVGKFCGGLTFKSPDDPACADLVAYAAKQSPAPPA